jgi:hypothetical protein
LIEGFFFALLPCKVDVPLLPQVGEVLALLVGVMTAGAERLPEISTTLPVTTLASQEDMLCRLKDASIITLLLSAVGVPSAP